MRIKMENKNQEGSTANRVFFICLPSSERPALSWFSYLVLVGAGYFLRRDNG